MSKLLLFVQPKMAILKRVSFWVICISLSAPSLTLAAGLSSYLNSDDFGECLASLINKKGGSAYLEGRQRQAEEMKKLLLQSKSMEPMKKIMFPLNQITLEANLASLPLIDYSYHPNDQIENLPLTSLLFSYYCRKKPCMQGDPVERNDLGKNIHDQIETAKKISVKQPEDQFVLKSNTALVLANPIVDWLLQQKPRSVDHWQLLKYASNQFNGDVLTALAVLGQMFSAETLAVKDRNRDAVLASKMKKLVNEDDKFPVGHNYHFWQIISASIIRNDTTLAKIFGYIDNSEPSYRFANKLGLNVADKLFEGTKSKIDYCRLDDNSKGNSISIKTEVRESLGKR